MRNRGDRGAGHAGRKFQTVVTALGAIGIGNRLVLVVDCVVRNQGLRLDRSVIHFERVLCVRQFVEQSINVLASQR